MSVEKVVLYRSVDGQLHDSEQVCLTRNFVLQTRPKIMELISKHDEKGEVSLAGNADAVCDFILKATPELVALLQPLVKPLEAPRRARRTKAEVTLEKAAKAVLENKAHTQAQPTPVVRPATAAPTSATTQRDEGATGEIGSLSTHEDEFV